jgi:hypothetical protein
MYTTSWRAPVPQQYTPANKQNQIRKTKRDGEIRIKGKKKESEREDRLACMAPAQSRQQTAASSQQTADSRQQTADSRQQAAGSRQQAADSRQQIAASSQQPAASSQQPADSSQKKREQGRTSLRAWFRRLASCLISTAVRVGEGGTEGAGRGGAGGRDRGNNRCCICSSVLSSSCPPSPPLACFSSAACSGLSSSCSCSAAAGPASPAPFSPLSATAVCSAAVLITQFSSTSISISTLCSSSTP